MDGAGAEGDARFIEARRKMVAEQLVRRGIRDARVLAAMTTVPRHAFVEGALADDAYADHPLPIGFGQTISQPYMVARATELAAPRPTDRALEVGAGCGYQAAVLGRLVAEVHGVEIVTGLAVRAQKTIETLGIGNVEIAAFDGGGGWPAHAPYDVILVSAGAPRVPPLLVDQLADGGRLVVPVGTREEHTLVVVRRVGDRYETLEDTRCRYVDLLGRFGVGSEPTVA
ncbi:MAG TPA: protein-L-isoaspartate(D-aspartate) O-methyltransferase [Polyangia bacterium]|nr:protein-L-isoaspartate(D-aspartate) O-methyltransferase [Polyangia bacterium]